MKLIFKMYLFILMVLSLGLSTITLAHNQNEKFSTLHEIEKKQQIESEKANKLFESFFMEMLMRKPVFQSYLGIKTNYGEWDDLSDAKAKADLEIRKGQLVKLQKEVDRDLLNRQSKISYDLFVKSVNDEVKTFKYRFHNYPVNQMFGVQSNLPSMLINIHRVSSVDDAESYISRLSKMHEVFNQVVENLELRAKKNIIAPRFVYPYVINDSENIIKGQPFDSSKKDSTLFADFKKKVAALEVEKSIKEDLIKRASEALIKSVKPAFKALISKAKQLEKIANDDAGAWKFPDGSNFYNSALEKTTTTQMSAEEIHKLGLSEVERIHAEMRAIMKTVKFEGTLPEFFEFMRKDPQFYLPETEQGRKKYLEQATAIVEKMKARLDELFIIKPKADMVVRAVEAFREKSAGKAFYQRPSPDGSRPGVYYANLYKMSDMPTYQMEALAFHEGIPGHHMQSAIATELEGIPKFRKYGRYTAYSEGWGLYTEFLPKEIGFYQDPYSDFGRLSMELWRACRLVVDTGIHVKKWNREQGIEYYLTNTPNPKGDAIKMVERHIVAPSQATAYKVGMLKILSLRAKAKKALSDKFDIREFHDVVLKNGPVPLNTLEVLVEQWVISKS